MRKELNARRVDLSGSRVDTRACVERLHSEHVAVSEMENIRLDCPRTTEVKEAWSNQISRLENRGQCQTLVFPKSHLGSDDPLKAKLRE